jgi:DNA-binding MarR family transcriptional regulator
MVINRGDKAGLAADAWRRIFDFVIATAGHRNRVLADLELTPNDARALSSLDEETGRTMRELANDWSIDASTATWIVDRLEAKGLAQRRAHPTDRRVKLVGLTPAGVHKRRELLIGTYTAPPELLELRESELEALRDAAAKLPPGRDARGEPGRTRSPRRRRPSVVDRADHV